MFNRPDLVRALLDRVRDASPRRLYIASDGPRKGNLADQHQIELCRKAVDAIDWTEVKTLYHEHNQGVDSAVTQAVDWFFQNEESGIVIEDDCMPSVDFFPYCAYLLEKYRHDERIGWINGSSFGYGTEERDSYLFINYPSSWGWASWKRVWERHDDSMAGWRPSANSSPSGNSSFAHRIYWNAAFEWASRFENWDLPATYTLMNMDVLACMPARNLISNLGFDDRAVHTRDPHDSLAALPTEPLSWPLIDPTQVVPSAEANAHFEKTVLRIGLRRTCQRLAFLWFPKLMTRLRRRLYE